MSKVLPTEVVFDDGVKDYYFKNKRGYVFATFSFNPSDTGLLSRYDEVAEKFGSIEFDEDGDIPEQIKTLDGTIKEMFDYLFGADMSNTLFKTYSPCTVFANGDFYAEVALNAIGGFIEAETGARLDNKIAKIKKDTAKNRS